MFSYFHTNYAILLAAIPPTCLILLKPSLLPYNFYFALAFTLFYYTSFFFLPLFISRGVFFFFLRSPIFRNNNPLISFLSLLSVSSAVRVRVKPEKTNSHSKLLLLFYSLAALGEIYFILYLYYIPCCFLNTIFSFLTVDWECRKNENAELKRRIKPKTYSKTVLQIHRCRFWELYIIQSISKIIIFVLFFFYRSIW